MPDLAALLPPTGTLSLLDILKVFGVPAALALLVRFLTRRDKARDEAATEATRLLKLRSETAENERVALRAESDKNKVEHERFHKALDDMKQATIMIQSDVQALKMDMTRADMRGEAIKESMARIDGQLGRLIDTYRTLS